jgi:cytidylate kinase
MTIIINLISGPGSGKTTLASYIFAMLKIKKYNIEYVQEYAKKLVWLEDYEKLNNQYLVSKKQIDLLKKISEKVDLIITDGCILHGLYFNKHNEKNVSNVEKTEKYIIDNFRQFENINIFIERGNFPYEKNGRIESEIESHYIDEQLKKYLNYYMIDHVIIKNDLEIIDEIIQYIEEKIKKILHGKINSKF